MDRQGENLCDLFPFESQLHAKIENKLKLALNDLAISNDNIDHIFKHHIFLAWVDLKQGVHRFLEKLLYLVFFDHLVEDLFRENRKSRKFFYNPLILFLFNGLINTSDNQSGGSDKFGAVIING